MRPPFSYLLLNVVFFIQPPFSNSLSPQLTIEFRASVPRIISTSWEHRTSLGAGIHTYVAVGLGGISEDNKTHRRICKMAHGYNDVRRPETLT